MTQTEQVMNHLLRHGSITPMVALNRYGCYRLSARIKDLRYKGHAIDTELEERKGKRYARYRYHSKQ